MSKKLKMTWLPAMPGALADLGVLGIDGVPHQAGAPEFCVLGAQLALSWPLLVDACEACSAAIQHVQRDHIRTGALTDGASMCEWHMSHLDTTMGRCMAASGQDGQRSPVSCKVWTRTENANAPAAAEQPMWLAAMCFTSRQAHIEQIFQQGAVVVWQVPERARLDPALVPLWQDGNV